MATGAVNRSHVAEELASWADTPTREQLSNFLDQIDDVSPADRVALFDNDGTLWVERPDYVQAEFIRHSLEQRVASDDKYEIPPAARLALDNMAVARSEFSLHELAVGLNDVFAGLTPSEFRHRAGRFAREHRNAHFGRPHIELRYRPMLELLEALRRRGCDCFIITGGGTEFVRSISLDAYGVSADRVVGSAVDYHVERHDGRPVLRRGRRMLGMPNEGDEKLFNIQQAIGRTPIFAAGNSAGDAPMLDLVQHVDGPSLALLIDHDDNEREIAYESIAASFDDGHNIVHVAERSGWLVASIRNDWVTVF